MKKTLFFAICFAALAIVSCEKPNSGNNGGNNEGEEPDTPVVVTPERVLEDFENGGMLTWTGADGASFEVADNPAKEGINTSDKVGKVTAGTGQWEFTWSTYFGVQEEGDQAEYLDFTNDGYIIRVMVRGPKAGAKVYLKIEGDGGVSREISTVSTTKANEWEVLEFDYEVMDVVDATYRNIVILFDAGTATAGGEEWYFDNIEQYIE